MQHKQEEADEVKRKLAEESRSDHIALLRAYEVHTKYIQHTLLWSVVHSLYTIGPTSYIYKCDQSMNLYYVETTTLIYVFIQP